MRSRVSAYSPSVISRSPTLASTWRESSGVSRPPLGANAEAPAEGAGSAVGLGLVWHALTSNSPPSAYAERARAEPLENERRSQGKQKASMREALQILRATQKCQIRPLRA